MSENSSLSLLFCSAAKKEARKSQSKKRSRSEGSCQSEGQRATRWHTGVCTAAIDFYSWSKVWLLTPGQLERSMGCTLYFCPSPTEPERDSDRFQSQSLTVKHEGRCCKRSTSIVVCLLCSPYPTHNWRGCVFNCLWTQMAEKSENDSDWSFLTMNLSKLGSETAAIPFSLQKFPLSDCGNKKLTTVREKMEEKIAS